MPGKKVKWADWKGEEEGPRKGRVGKEWARNEEVCRIGEEGGRVRLLKTKSNCDGEVVGRKAGWA